MNKIFNLPPEQLLYSPMIGVYPAKLNLHTPYIKNIAKIFFKILDESKIEYYLFAGSSIGLLRNGKSIPWVDDYDIIIFDKDLAKLEKVLKVFENNYFKTRRVEIRNNFQHRAKNGMPLPVLAGYVVGTPRYQINGMKTSFFQCDIFLSKSENNIIRNVGGWGLYHRKNIDMSLIRPPKYHNFDDTNIPFFNNHVKDIEKEYGDVINTSIIHILHGREKIVINKHWEQSYKDFYDIQNKAIENTKKLINYQSLENTNEIEFLSDINIHHDDYLAMMNYITQNYHKATNKILKLYNYTNVKFILDIKFFYPDIQVELHVKSFINFDSIRFFLNEIALINVYEKNTFSKIDIFLRSMILIHRPDLKLLSETNLDKNLIIDNRIHTVDYSMLVNRKNNVINTKTQPVLMVRLQEDKPEKQEEGVKSNKKLTNKNIHLIKNYVAHVQTESPKLEDIQINQTITKPIHKSNGILKIPPKKEEVPVPTVKPIKIKKI